MVAPVTFYGGKTIKYILNLLTTMDQHAEYEGARAYSPALRFDLPSFMSQARKDILYGVMNDLRQSLSVPNNRFGANPQFDTLNL